MFLTRKVLHIKQELWSRRNFVQINKLGIGLLHCKSCHFECLLNILQGKHLYELSVLFSVANSISFPSLLSNTFWNVNLTFCSFLANMICENKNEMAKFVIVNDHTVFRQLFFLVTKIIAIKFHKHKQWKQKFRVVLFKWLLGENHVLQFKEAP